MKKEKFGKELHMRYCFMVLLIIMIMSVSAAYGGYVFEGDIDYDVVASSELKSPGHTYAASNLNDVNPDTAWCEGSKGNGAGQWLQFDLKGRPGQVVSGLSIRILPGYGKARTLFVANARPSGVRVSLIDKNTNEEVGTGKGEMVDLHDSLETQEIDLPLAKAVSPDSLRIRIEIEGVYKGARYDDMCITEVRVFSNRSTAGELNREEEQQIEKIETDELKRLLPAAQTGDKTAMQGLIRLSDSSYFRSAEGGEWLAQIYLELFYKYPDDFLFITSKQTGEIRKKVEDSVVSPVVDIYSSQQIVDRLKGINNAGITEEYKNKLISDIKRIHGAQ